MNELYGVLAFLLLSAGCSAGSSSASSATGGAGGINPAGQGGSTASGGADAGAEAGSCPTWPIARLFPWVGPFFFGPDPGPCTHTQQGGGVTNLFTLTYDAAGKLVSEVSANSSHAFTYSSDGRLASEADTGNAGQTNFTFLYPDAVHAGYTQVNSRGESTVMYMLDAQGYPQSGTATGQVVNDGAPTRWVYQYTNCRITERIAYDLDGGPYSNYTATFSYDSAGHLLEIKSGTWDDVFDYACWGD